MTPSSRDTRVYAPEEERQILEQLRGLTRRVLRGQFVDRPLGIPLMQQFHHEIFDGVRGHAGRHRSSDFGQERLDFGPHKSKHRDEVSALLEKLFAQANHYLRVLDGDNLLDGFERQAVQLATWLHAEIIRIHPFEDGNGRTSRAMLNWTLLRTRLCPVRFERPKGEYFDCLNHYFSTNDMQLLFDFVLGLFGDAVLLDSAHRAEMPTSPHHWL